MTCTVKSPSLSDAQAFVVAVRKNRNEHDTHTHVTNNANNETSFRFFGRKLLMSSTIHLSCNCTHIKKTTTEETNQSDREE